MINLNMSTKMPPAVRRYILIKIILLLLMISLPILLFSRVAWISVFIVLLFIIGLPLYIYFLIYYNFLNFIVEEDKITINSGVIARRSNSISFEQVQNVNNVKGILAQLFGLSSVDIWTASPAQISMGNKNSTLHKPTASLWLADADGKWLQEFILSKHS